MRLEYPFIPPLATESSPSSCFQGKRVRFKPDPNLESHRFFFENQPVDQFVTTSPNKRVIHSASSEKDFFRSQGPEDFLGHKEKKIFNQLSPLFFSPKIFSLEEFKEDFSKLFFAPYFQLHLTHMLRDLKGSNELDFDLKDVVRGFVLFMTSCVDEKNDNSAMKGKTLSWIDSMLNESIYKEGQALLKENIDEIVSFYQKSHERIEQILNPSGCQDSPSYKISSNFWIHFLSLYPKKRFLLEMVIRPSHTLYHAIDSEMGEIVRAGGMWKDFCDTLVEDLIEIINEKGFLTALIESPTEMMMKTLRCMIVEHPLVKLWGVEESIENLSLLEPGISHSGFNSVFLTSLMRSQNRSITPLKVKIIFEYAILHLKKLTQTATSEDYLRTIFEGLRAFPLTDRQQNPIFSLRGALWQLFHNPTPLQPVLERRFWHSLYTQSNEARHILGLKDQLSRAGRNQ